MAGDKLTLYNGALAHLEQRRIPNLASQSESRRVFDDLWDKEVAWCLERHFWNFAYRAVQLDASVSIDPSFGFIYGFTIPTDWIRTRKLSSSPTFDPPLLQVAEEAGLWYTNVTPIYVQYNSNDRAYGMDLGKWPASFCDFVETRLARKGCKRITNSSELLDGLIKQEDRARRVAAANCAMNEAVGFAPMTGWVRARRGFGVMPGPGGDSPTGGSLIP